MRGTWVLLIGLLVMGCGDDGRPSGPQNTPPESAAGADQSGETGQTFTLDGSGSSDADGDWLSYVWREDPDNPATGLLSNAAATSPTFSPALPGTYRFALTVSDGSVDSQPDTVVAVAVDAAFTGIATLPGGAQMEYVWIEPGTFTMGSPDSEISALNATYGTDWFSHEGPQHEVTITHGFWLGKTEITQGQWEAVMGTTPWSGKHYVQANPEHPAVYVSWTDVQGLIDQLNMDAGATVYGLPTEAQWEYACRAGTTTRWSFGDDEGQLGDYAWYEANAWDAGLEYAQPVGTRLANSWGLFDMHGNVYEWVQDGSGSYASGAQTDPQGVSTGSSRVFRGGLFINGAWDARSASRHAGPPGERSSSIGVRLSRTR